MCASVELEPGKPEEIQSFPAISPFAFFHKRERKWLLALAPTEARSFRLYSPPHSPSFRSKVSSFPFPTSLPRRRPYSRSVAARFAASDWRRLAINPKLTPCCSTARMNTFVFPAKIAAHNPAPPYSEKEGHRRRPSYPSVSSPEHFLPPSTPTRANALPRFNGSPPRRKTDHFRRSSTHALLPFPLKTLALCFALLCFVVISITYPLRLFSPRHSPRPSHVRVDTQYVDHAFVPEPKPARKPRIVPGRKERPFPGQQENRRGSVNNPVGRVTPQRLPAAEDRPATAVVEAEKVVEKKVVEEVPVKMAREGGIQGGRYRGAPLPPNQIAPGQLRAGKKQRVVPTEPIHDHPLPVSPPASKDAASPKRKVMQFGKVKGKAATRAALLLQNRKEAFAAESAAQREVLEEEEAGVEGEQVRVDSSGNQVKGEDAAGSEDAGGK